MEQGLSAAFYYIIDCHHQSIFALNGLEHVGRVYRLHILIVMLLLLGYWCKGLY